MGNRAVIEFQGSGIGIYLHWNGGQESVEAFLKAARMLGVRSDDYGPARLCQVIGNYFGGNLSLGVGKIETLDCDNGDNGKYVIKDWQIVEHTYGIISIPWVPTQDEIDAGEGIFKEVMKINKPIFDRE